MKAELMKPDWAFRPDAWSDVFLRGLSKVTPDLNGKTVWEVGTGTGFNIVELYEEAQALKWYFSDLNPECTLLAHENIFNSIGFYSGNLYPLHGEWDLVTPPEGSDIEPPKVDVIFGCIPQVPAEFNLLEKDNMAHYYNPSKYPSSHLHMLGLGLNETLLIRARNLVSDFIVLNLCGRPGIQHLLNMFKNSGYIPDIIHKEIVAQHYGTCLESLVLFEKKGFHEFEFFADREGESRISAREAENLRINQRSVYHMIYVIKGLVA